MLRRIENARIADIPGVVASGAEDEEMAQVCMNLGAAMYIVKPISFVHVMNVIVSVEKHWLAAENFPITGTQYLNLDWFATFVSIDAVKIDRHL